MTAPRALACLLLLLTFSTAGCSPGTEPATPATEVRVEARAAAALQQLTEVLLKPWRRELRALKEVEASHATLLEHSRTGFREGATLERDLGAPFPQVLQALQLLVPVADRLYAMDQHFATLEKGFRLPAGTSSPLVLRLATLFRRARDEAWKLVNDGLDDLRQGKEATRFQLGLAQLGHTRSEGEKLLQEMLTLAQHVDSVRSLKPALDKALSAAKQRLASMRAAANPAADALEASVRAVEAALSGLLDRITTTAELLCTRPGEAATLEAELRSEITGLAASLR